ncbi:MAG TPA: DNA polymerase Y family protein [Streptosporangiaceae bacterium]|nr:DNA polymerase Y family protein [Streptosporangiaceae bacterium]
MMAGAVLPERVLVVWCPGRQDAEPGRVVSVVEGFCPRVEMLRPGACAIGVRGPARYFGGEAVLAAKIIEAAAGAGLVSQVGIADGLLAAGLAAGRARKTPRTPRTQRAQGAQGTRHAGRLPVLAVAPGRTRAFLAPFPVSVLGSQDLADLLPRLGIRTLGEFASLPAAEVTNRFGTPGVIAHRLARGLDPRRLVPRPPPAGLSVSAGFDPPARQAEPVVFAAKALAEHMHNGLAARGLACVRVRVQAVWEDGGEITRLWRHDGLLSALAVAERVRWQLAGWQPSPAQGGDDAVLAGGITLLRLVPDQLVRDQGRQLGLWGDAVASDRVDRAAMGVQAMLGHGAVTRPAPAGGRGPAEQVRLVPFGGTDDPAPPAGRPGTPGTPGGRARSGGPGGRAGSGGPGGPGEPWPGRIPAPFPATVYSDPLPARVADGSGATVAVSGRGLVSAPPDRMSAGGAPWQVITAWAGPWPVAERWWDPRTARRRARFQLVTEDGAAWLAAVQDGSWLIEARYD